MKYLLILSILISTVSRGQNDSAQRYCIVNADSFLIKYKFTGWITEPAVARFKTVDGKTTEDFEAYANNRHYASMISVYIVEGGKTQLIGKEFPGTYIPAGCFEHVPEEDVKKAMAMEQKMPHVCFGCSSKIKNKITTLKAKWSVNDIYADSVSQPRTATAWVTLQHQVNALQMQVAELKHRIDEEGKVTFGQMENIHLFGEWIEQTRIWQDSLIRALQGKQTRYPMGESPNMSIRGAEEFWKRQTDTGFKVFPDTIPPRYRNSPGEGIDSGYWKLWFSRLRVDSTNRHFIDMGNGCILPVVRHSKHWARKHKKKMK